MSLLAREIINAVLSTPDLPQEYFCHGEVQTKYKPDLLEMEDRVDKLLGELEHILEKARKYVTGYAVGSEKNLEWYDKRSN